VFNGSHFNFIPLSRSSNHESSERREAASLRSPARALRTNHPVLLTLDVPAPNSLVAAGTLKNGLPTVTAPSLGNGVIDIAPNIAVNSTLPEFERGYVQSWNLTVEREMFSGFTGQVGYIGTRQIRMLGYHDLNTGRVGGGAASRPFN
jgi:hypothetical protein